jgi:hypothetical protein
VPLSRLQVEHPLVLRSIQFDSATKLSGIAAEVLAFHPDPTAEARWTR